MKVIIYMDYSWNFGVDYFYFLFSPDEHHDSEYSGPARGSRVSRALIQMLIVGLYM